MRLGNLVLASFAILAAYTAGVAYLGGQMAETRHADDWTRGYNTGWHDRQNVEDRHVAALAAMGMCSYALVACKGAK